MPAVLPTVAPSLHPPARPVSTGGWLATGFVALAVAAATLSGLFPIGFSILIVFLFAGPHNWFEARYILGRLPARTGKLRTFFLASLAGILGLTAGFALIPSYLVAAPEVAAETLYAGWNTAFLLWVASLVRMRSRTNPRFDGGWVWPLTCLLIAGVWARPFALSVLLVYLHPCMALWLFDRELARSRPTWRPAYRTALLAIPALLAALYGLLGSAPALPGDDPVSSAITRHSGDWFLTGVSNHFLVAAHTFLEMVHYGVWILLMPLVGIRSKPWDLRTIPAARRDRTWVRGVAGLLLFGLFVVAVLWASFLLDYGMTRQVYFLIAMLHVLAEVPFLLRMI